MKRVSVSFIVLFLVGILPLLVSCDKQAALEQIYKDPVLRQSILDRVAADTEMINSMVDRAFERVDMTEKMMRHFIEDKELESEMLDLIIADSTAHEMLVAKIKEHSDLVRAIRRR
ncbi:MAG: hypothetical protein E3J45_08075 [Candidatus Zixiibacteriota bacterium]|nr:MAG: hypothetical protein E3J45_08075 [candidate division Zixibacteria bacterium]